MAKKNRKGPRRRVNRLARGRHPKEGEGLKDRAKRYDREAGMEHRRQHQAIAPDGGKAKPLQAVEPKQKMKFCFSQNIFFLIRSIRSPAKVELVVTELLITSPVVRWRGWETPPSSPAPRLNCHSLHDLERRSGGREDGPSYLFLGKY